MRNLFRSCEMNINDKFKEHIIEDFENNYFINSILNKEGIEYTNGEIRKFSSFEKGIRRMLLEMEEDEYKNFIRGINYDRKRIIRSKKYYEKK